MEFNALRTKRAALGLAGTAMIWTATTAQAQLYIDVYPSQDNPDSETLWIFSGSSIANYGSSIRSSGNYHARDSWKLNAAHGVDVYFANQPTNQLVSLSPLFSSANNPIDIESVQVRGSFGSARTNAPTMTAGSANKTIGSIFMNRGLRSDLSTGDEIGIRGTSGGNLVYTNGQTFRWIGSGILAKPIGDFTN